MHVGMGTFFQNLDGVRSDAEVYAHELSMADLAEPLGFDSVWAAEHHFDGYTMCPNVTQLLTWVGARTRRVRLGSMVVVLPWHDPVRVAESFAVLDHMTGGRSILGMGRGLARIEFEGFRVQMGESRGRFVEYAEAILEALETGFIEYDGEFSVEIMARLGVGIMIIAQKPWDTALAELAAYRHIHREVRGSEAPRPLLVSFVAVHESEDAAREMYERYLLGYCHSVLRHYEFAEAGLAEIPGYEYYGKLSENVRRHGPDGFARFLADLQVWGTPDQVVERMIEHQRMLDSAGAIGVFSYGGMPPEVAKANLRTFSERVLPRLRAHAGEAALGSTPAAAAR
jgi:alkanesulfonate monooxygenase SsuD/methylene tetrahydromethanopterin reductase-like flavin-dependent oxidoreductase (luciferase family)